MFFSYKKRTKRILNISMGRVPETVLSPFFAGGEWRRHEGMPPYARTLCHS